MTAAVRVVTAKFRNVNESEWTGGWSFFVYFGHDDIQWWGLTDRRCISVTRDLLSHWKEYLSSRLIVCSRVCKLGPRDEGWWVFNLGNYGHHAVLEWRAFLKMGWMSDSLPHVICRRDVADKRLCNYNHFFNWLRTNFYILLPQSFWAALSLSINQSRCLIWLGRAFECLQLQACVLAAVKC